MKNVYRSLMFVIAAGMQSIYAASVTGVLDDSRILLLDDYYLTGDVPPTWVHVGPAPSGTPNAPYIGLLAGTNHYHRTGWVFVNTRIGQRTASGARYVPPQVPTNYSAHLMNTASAAVYSPIFTNGAGTLYFEAVNVVLTTPVELAVDIATNMVGGAALSGSMTNASVAWQLDVFKTNLTSTTTSVEGFVRIAEKLDIRQPVAIRIRRATVASGVADNNYACVDNIRVSPSVPDIVFSDIKGVLDGGGTFVECVVSNTPGTLARTDYTSRGIQLHYQWYDTTTTQTLQNAAMTYQPATGTDGDGEAWKATFTFAPGMMMRYYFVYSGATVYQSPDYTEKGYAYPPETGVRVPEETLVEEDSYLYGVPGDVETVTVTFHPQGGSVSPTSRDYSVSWWYKNAGGLPTPTRLGYTFGGWFADADCLGVEVDGDTQVLAEVTDLYAKWNPCTYIVRYNSNSGSGTMDDSTHTYDVAANLTMNGFARNGYGFKGWATNAPYTTVAYTNGESVVNLSPVQSFVVNLYAVWTGQVYTVSLDQQGGSGAPASIAVTYDSPYGTLPNSSRQGYTPAGWYTMPNGGGAQITATTPVTTQGNHTLYANWMVNSYTVTFDAQGGSVSPGSKTVTYDTLYGTLPVPVRYGFVFAGWFTSGGVQVTANTPVTITANQTLLAKWAENTDWYTTNQWAITYIIMNEEEMHGLSKLVNGEVTDFSGKTVILGVDLNMTVTPAAWMPIGTNTAVTFTGTFNGQGKVIAGLNINLGSSDNVGLFGVLGVGGVIENVNLTLTGCTVIGNTNVGGLVGRNRGLVQNCQVLEGEIQGSVNVGGLAGVNDVEMYNCFSTALVNTGTPRGGVAGRNESGAVMKNGYWLNGSSATGIGNNSGTASEVYSFSGYPGTLSGTAFNTQVLADALNGWVQAQTTAFYWWTAGTGTSHPLLTQFAPSLIVHQLDESRILLFDDYYLTGNSPPTWTHIGPAPTGTPNTPYIGLLAGTNHTHRTGWVFANTRMGQRTASGARYVPPQMAANYTPPTLTTNYSAHLMNTVYATIYSPIFTNGIGTLYFEAVNVVLTTPVELAVDIATNMTNGAGLSGSMTGLDVGWQYVFTTMLNSTTTAEGFLRIAEKLDIRQPVAIRIRRVAVASGVADNNYACIDNIRVSLPPADIVMSKPLVPFDIGYPSVNTPGGQAQCWLDNRIGPFSTSYLGGTRTNVQVVSRWSYIPAIANPPAGWRSAWQTNTLVCVDAGNGSGNGEKWEGLVPPYPDVGTLEYYFVGAFNGTRYQSPDYTERGYIYRPEDPSPQICAAKVTTNMVSWTVSLDTPFQFDVRQYPAAFGEAVAFTDQFGPIPMYLSGTNEWQARVSVVGTSVNNITWYFKGSGEYLGNYTFSPDTVYWCNLTGIRGGVLPYGDNALRTLDPDIATNEAYRFEVKVDPTESNFVLLTLNTAQTNFMAGRGEYQNFNLWNPGDAGEEKFTDTSDKYPKHAFSENFNGWYTNTFFAISNYFGNISVSNLANQTFLWPEDQVGTIDWMAGSFEYAIERTPVKDPPDTPGVSWRNQAIRLLGGNQYLGLGYIQGNERQYGQQGLRGVGTVSFKARLSQKIVPGAYNYNIPVNMKNYTASNYMVRTTIRCSSPSVERPSVSLIAYYQSPLNFYEYRVTQAPDPADITSTTTIDPNKDNIILHEIIRWSNGTPSVLNSTTNSGRLTSLLTDSGNFEFRLYTDPLTGNVSLVGLLGPATTGQSVIANQPGTAGSLKFGTFGVHSSDCTIEVSSLGTGPTSAGAANAIVGQPTPQLTPGGDWSMPLQYLHNNVRILSLIPTNQVNVLTGATLNGPWTIRNTFTLASFSNATLTASIQGAAPMCVRIQAAGTAPNRPSSDIVVDGIVATSWRGENMPSSPTMTEWAVTESWLVSNSASGGVDNKISVRMDASQSDPSLPQSIRSPRIMGIGTISFDYRSLTANPTAIQIQYMPNTLNPSLTTFTGWLNLTNIVCNSSTWSTVNIYFGQLAETNLYVRFLHDWHDDVGHDAQSTMKSIIEIDNVTIWDNPTNSPNDWVAYNAKITNTETNRWWIDGLEGGRNLSLNNSPVDQAFPSPQDAFDPYIMSPKLKKGLGRISFIARAYDPASALVQNTSISVYVTKKPWSMNIDSSDWEKLHTFAPITNAFYRPFSFAVTNGLNQYTAVKLAVDGGKENASDRQRVCIDEILVTEQIYAKFDISNVRLLLPDLDWIETRQPLEGQDIAVEAQLTNVLLQPSNIVMYVSYVTGTNTWGVMNAPQLEVKTVPMELVDPGQRIYRTKEPVIYWGIPEQPNNTVVQYLVWAQYEDAGVLEVYQEPDTFVHPEWYYPIDLNARFSAKGWSPYYIVYDVPPGSVWINEVAAFESSNYHPVYPWQGNPYIEIAMPAWMSLSGWTIEIAKNDPLNPTVIPITLPQSGLPVKTPYPGANGYAFFVIGPPAQALPSGVLSPLPVVDFPIANLGGVNAGALMSYWGVNGLRLKRPMGMYEQAVAQDWTPGYESGLYWEQADPQKRFKYIGSDKDDGALSFTGAVTKVSERYDRTDNTSTWTLMEWTPGAPNLGQVMPDAPEPGGLNVLITSEMTSINGLQNGLRTKTYLLKVRRNDSTNIVYQADSWWRLYSVKTNGIEKLPTSPVSSFTLDLNNIQSNIYVNVKLDVREDMLGENYPPDILDWLQGFDDLPFAPTYLNVIHPLAPQLSLREKFWINANPTTTNLFTFKTHATEVHLRPLYLTLEMALNGNKVEHLQGGSVVQAWASYSLSPPDWFMVSQYILSPNSFDNDRKGRVYINAFPEQPAFFKWTLDLEDQRSSTFEMINLPKP